MAREASGSANRSSCLDSVRYLSVTIVVQRRLLTEDDTTHDGREAVESPAHGLFRR
jgi:hypothetical protein